MFEIRVPTRNHEEWIDVTAEVQKRVSESGVSDGVCVVFVPHTTAGVTIQENADPSVVSDCLMALKRMVPDDLPFTHAEGNSTAHVKCSLTGSSVHGLIENGKLALGTWQAIYFCEYDGPRQRKMWMSVTAGS